MTNNPMFDSLFTALTVGPVTLPNRIVSSAHDTVMTKDGRVTDQLVAYHKARAEGGVGLIVVQAAGVHETARYTSHVLMAADDSCIDGYRRLAEAVHPFGTRMFGQLFHPGREVMDPLEDGSAQVPVAPSAVPQERFHVMPRALLVTEIREIIEGYASAALRLAQAGLDGVEVVASHGYLPAQFLNPRVNHRDDDYGGSPENRARFLHEVVRAVRAKVASRIAVGLRISIGERDPEGLDKQTALTTCTDLADEGLLDYVSVTVGTSASLAGSDHIVPDMNWANGYVTAESRLVKDAVGSLPVFVAGRINQPQEAERILLAGDADACIMTRALISDPRMPRLAKAGKADDIRACIACNQACIGHFHAGFPISCVQRPETGRELLYGTPARTSHPKKVLVIGAGPAGMKAAVIAAQRGHQVRLCEATGRVGGQVLLAERLPGRDEFGGAATNLAHEVQREDIELVLHKRMDVDAVRAEAADVVILATGATPYRPDLDLTDEAVVKDAWDIASGQSMPAGHIVVADWRGDWIGIGVARLLANTHHQVTLAVNGYGAAQMLQQYVRDSALAALHREKITVLSLMRPYGADGDSVYLQHVLTEEPVVLDNVVGLVLACGHRSNTGLLGQLQQAGTPAIAIGDCRTPRTIEEAILEGLTTSSSI
ncbi:FAD-dependent oxidoreductase [Leekyejoonella antrihumi]|uniref:FAD-dependent oxidoreductase n=1 Tax=Leekyejoonella antrihumi TaxID=1660198 RepID=A0A563E427_9MICO|nr:FAD-dependent oxidoreductase [Leekyejoonella antrihumi]TWP36624.1 FAD-dependent oxidoreductase [Leekyejoonella antrihumi]